MLCLLVERPVLRSPKARLPNMYSSRCSCRAASSEQQDDDKFLISKVARKIKSNFSSKESHWHEQ